MQSTSFQHLYGPVPSRRLRRSLGIDLVPLKTCTYDCIYCQLGRTTNQTIERKEYVAVADILEELEQKLACGDTPDYITLAGSGEPTLHSGIADLIREIKAMSAIPVAVLTNGSLLWMEKVQDALMGADLVIPSLDAGDERLFRYVNRSHETISFDKMVDGLAAFTRRFSGEVWLEVLLLWGVTGILAETRKVASLVRRIAPSRVQLNTVVRPPSEDFAFSLSRAQLQALSSEFPGPVDIICETERSDAPAPFPNDVEDDDILALLRRRPCTYRDVARGLDIHVAEAIKHLDRLMAAGKTRTIFGRSRTFYVPAGPSALEQQLEGTIPE